VVIVLQAIHEVPTFFGSLSIAAAGGIQKVGSDLTDRSVSCQTVSRGAKQLAHTVDASLASGVQGASPTGRASCQTCGGRPRAHCRMAVKPQSTPSAPLNSRRAEICRRAAQIFQERGFDATSVSDIARALDMTKAGLYHYFTSKEALLFEIMMFGLERVHDEVLVPVRAIRDPEVRLRQLIVRHARIATRARGAVAFLVDEARALPPAQRSKIEQRMRVYIDLLRDTLTELKKTHRLRDVDPTVGAFSIAGMILWLPRWFRQGGRLTPEEAADEIANLALGGLIRTPTASPRKSRARTS